MRSIVCYFVVLQFLLLATLQVTYAVNILPTVSKNQHSVKCFNQQREITSALQTEIHVDCNKLWNWGSCESNTTHIFNWLPEFYQNVTSLHLEENCITKIPVLPYLPKMTLLKYRHNKVEFIEDGAFNNLPSLETLDLSHNSLTEIRPSIFKRNNFSRNGSLPIKSIHLGFNKVQSINYKMFEQLSLLRELHLDGNPLGIIDSSTAMAIQFAGRQSLEVLNLAKTGISSFPDEIFIGSKIKSLYINGDNFHEVPQELINLRETLEFININENPIRELNSEFFFGLHQLKEIVAAGMENLTVVNGGTFLHLKSLEQLTLSYNHRLSFIDPNAFCVDSCKSTPSMIKIVYLSHNNLHYLPEDLLPWGQLEELSLSSNPWVCDWKNQWMINLKSERNHIFTDDLSDICSPGDFEISCDNQQKPGCVHNADYYFKRKINVTLEVLMFLSLIVSIIFLIGVLALRIIGKSQSKQSPSISVINAPSTSLRYNKLVNKPSYAI